MMFKVFKYAGIFIELLLDKALNYLSFDYLYPCCYAILAVGDGGSLHRSCWMFLHDSGEHSAAGGQD
jgi:hypothetical protein